MIKEAYVSFEVAKLLREKGFEEICFAYYEDFGKEQHLYMHDKRGAYNKGFKQRDSLAIRFNIKKNYKCSAPTQQLAMRWLREVHNLNIEVYRTACGYVYCIVKIPSGTDLHWDNNSGDDLPSGTWTAHEKAVEAALKYCLENLI